MIHAGLENPFPCGPVLLVAGYGGWRSLLTPALQGKQSGFCESKHMVQGLHVGE